MIDPCMDNSAVHKFGLRYSEGWKNYIINWTGKGSDKAMSMAKDRCFQALHSPLEGGLRKDFAYYEVYGYK